VKKDVKRARKLGPLPPPVCSRRCADYDPSIGCYRFCPSAPRRLSSDANSPVEALIAPLVFELKRLGVFHPCWSCEGHNDEAGNLLKVPRVWFYADSVVHLRALANSIERLFCARRLSTRWIVVLTHSDPDNPDTTFSLEPDLAGANLKLQNVQDGARAIAESLEHDFQTACAQLV
jgi:hypothetical protein